MVLNAIAFGKNIDQPINVKIGNEEKSVTFSSAWKTKNIEFALKEPASLIEITIPYPTVPESGNRKLGIGLAKMSIEQ